MSTKTCSTISYNGGSFRLVVDYSYSGGSMLFTAKCDIVSKMKDSHYFTLEWGDGKTTLKDDTASKYNKDFNWVQRSVRGNVLYVSLYPKGVTSKTSTTNKLTHVITIVPSISATYVNDSCVDVVVSGISSENNPTSKVSIERSTSADSGFSEIVELNVTPSNNKYEVEHSDTGVETGNRYYYRARAYNASSEWSDYDKCGPVYTKASSDSVSNVSTSKVGNEVTVSWTCNLADIVSGVVTEFIVMASANGGTYDKIGTVDAVVGQSSYSLPHTINAGSTYTYRVDVKGNGGQSSGGATGGSEIETVPNNPSVVTAYRNASDNVVVTVTGSSSNADSVVIERSIDGGDYSVRTTENYASSVTYTDTSATASDNIIYRAKYTNTAGSSGYAYSTAVLVKQKPNAPYLKSPFNGTPIDKAQGTVRLVWEHRPLDGSPQQNAKLQYKIGSGSWTTINLTTATYYDLDISSMTANAVITWKVSTKGSHADYSDYSAEYTLCIKTRPTLEFTEPDNADVITSLPVVMEWSYNDACGTLQELKVEVVKDNEVVKSFNVDVGSGQSGTYTYSLAGFLFDNNTVYGLKAYALSSSGLSAEDNISITIQYAEVSIAGGLLPSVVSDAETGYATITCLRDVTDGVSPVTISEAYLYRVHDNETVLIDAVTEGMQILDKYAPINVDYQYKLLYMTTGGSVAIVSVTVRNMSQYWFCYFGDEIAKAVWNPTGSVTLGRPQRTEVRYSGRRFPVSYDQDALEETYAFSTVLMERDELNKFRKLMQSGGQGIWKSGDGDAYDANFTFDYSSDFKSNQPMWNCTLAVTRIDGGE